MSTGNGACSPRDFTFLYSGPQVLSVLPFQFGHGRRVLATINFHPFLVFIALLLPFFVEIELFLSPGLRAFFCLPPKSHSSAI